MRGDLIADRGNGVWIGGIQLDGLTPYPGITLRTPQAPGDDCLAEGAPAAVGLWEVVACVATIRNDLGPRIRVVVIPLNPAASWAVIRAEHLAKEALGEEESSTKEKPSS